MAITYLDTSAFNELGLELHLIAKTGNYEFLVSSCQIGEFVCAEPSRLIQLAKLAWEVTNRRKLLEWVQIMYAELLAELGRGLALRRLEDYYDPAPEFIRAWNLLIIGQLPYQNVEKTKDHILTLKEEYRRCNIDENQPLRLHINRLKQMGIRQKWDAFLAETEAEGWFNEFIYTNLRIYPQFAPYLIWEDIRRVDYRRLRCTSVGLQYYIASHWLAIHGEGDLARITRGDLVDVRHAFYAGLADCYVTGDTKMHHILTKMVPQNRAKVISPQELRRHAIGGSDRQTISPELWARLALDQLFSDQWRRTIEEYHGIISGHTPRIFVTAQCFVAEVLGAHLALLGFVATRSNVDLGIAYHIQLVEYLIKLSPALQENLREAQAYCNKKVGEYGLKDISAYTAIAHASAERLNLMNCQEFVNALEAEFAGLGETWITDIAKYRFLHG